MKIYFLSSLFSLLDRMSYDLRVIDLKWRIEYKEVV